MYSWAIILWQLITGAHEPYEGYSDKVAFVRDVGERGAPSRVCGSAGAQITL